MMSSTSVGSRAGFVERLIAAIIDGVILLVVNVVIRAILGPVIASPIGILIGLAYAVYFWTSTGATVGKQVMGLKVVAIDGSTLTTGKAVIRYVGYWVSAIPLLLGFLWVLWDPEKQGFHDKIAGTYVIKTR